MTVALEITMAKTLRPSLIIGLVCAVLSGCGAEPPGCAAQETQTLATEIFKTEIKKQLTTFAGLQSKDDKHAIASFVQNLKLEISQVVDNGYSREAKKRSCKAKFELRFPSESSSLKGNSSDIARALVGPSAIDSPFSLQMTVDKQGMYLLEIENVAPLVQVAAMHFNMQVVDTLQREAEKRIAEQSAAVANSSNATKPIESATKSEVPTTFKYDGGAVVLQPDCSAISEKDGIGTWAWANGGVFVKLERKGEVRFPRADSPYEDDRCRLQ